MNECPKCQGRLIVERDLIDGERVKCLNCGWNREADAMPKFKSDEDRQAWIRKIRETRARNKALKGGVASAQPAAGGGTRSAIAAAIEEIDQQIAALETVKRNLLQADRLVHL